VRSELRKIGQLASLVCLPKPSLDLVIHLSELNVQAPDLFAQSAVVFDKARFDSFYSCALRTHLRQDRLESIGCSTTAV
jgi:hypothetical protein